MSRLLGCTVLLLLSGTESVPSDSFLEEASRSAGDPGPLFLTPLIEAGNISEARNKSYIPLFKKNFSVEAFSGYITVNETAESNLFFLLVVAQGNKSKAPLLLWTQGGPGLSALFGQFLQNGPVEYHPDKNFTRRANTLQNNMSVLYVDLPVGAGFSFTKGIYPRSLEDITDSAMELLDQFLKLFPEYICRDFYVAGESYAARYSVSIAHRLLHNPKNVSLVLKGTIGGNGFLGPILDLANSSEFLYQTSMVDENGRDELSAMFQNMSFLMTLNRSYVPPILMTTIFADPTGKILTLFQKLTSYSDHASPIYPVRPWYMQACFILLNNSISIRKIFHVGQNSKFEYLNWPLLLNLSNDYVTDISNTTQELLNKSDVLLYNGQLDALFPAVNQRAYLLRLNWSQSERYRTANRSPWYSPGKNSMFDGFAGYVRQVPKFTEAVILGMSHYGAAEKPDEVYYLMMDFIANWSTQALTSI